MSLRVVVTCDRCGLDGGEDDMRRIGQSACVAEAPKVLADLCATCMIELANWLTPRQYHGGAGTLGGYVIGGVMTIEDPKLREFIQQIMTERIILRNALQSAHDALMNSVSVGPYAEKRYAAIGLSAEVLKNAQGLHLSPEIEAMFRADPDFTKACRVALAPLPDEAVQPAAPALQVVPPLEPLADVLPFDDAAADKSDAQQEGEKK